MFKKMSLMVNAFCTQTIKRINVTHADLNMLKLCILSEL